MWRNNLSNSIELVGASLPGMKMPAQAGDKKEGITGERGGGGIGVNSTVCWSLANTH